MKKMAAINISQRLLSLQYMVLKFEPHFRESDWEENLPERTKRAESLLTRFVLHTLRPLIH